LGNTIDGSFAQALQDAIDPFGNLDTDPALLIAPHNPRAAQYPFLPVRTAQLPTGDVNEFTRPWAYPDKSVNPARTLYNTPGEQSNIRRELDFVGLAGDLRSILAAGVSAVAGTVSGPYPQGATPDQVLFRTGRPVSPGVRADYEQAPTPAHTDALNEEHIGRSATADSSPLGDPMQLCGYLMGQILQPDYAYGVDFNLDADRGYGYRCWDWIRGDQTGTDQRGQPYNLPVIAPEGAEAGPTYAAPPVQWQGAPPSTNQLPIQLRYLPGGEQGEPLP
jgi:hypothetical protein